MLVHPDPGLEHEVLLDREAGDEEILLLDVGGHGGQVSRGDHLSISDPGAGDVQALGVPEEEGVEEGRLARSARPHDGQDLGYKCTQNWFWTVMMVSTSPGLAIPVTSLRILLAVFSCLTTSPATLLSATALVETLSLVQANVIPSSTLIADSMDFFPS